MTFEKGDPIWVTVGDRRMEGEILLASSNQQSLMVAMDGMIWTKDGRGGVAAMAPLALGSDGQYYLLMDEDTKVLVEPRDV